MRVSLIFLFVYTAIDKLLHLHRNTEVMAQMPGLKNIAELLAVGVPVIELVITFLLVIPATIMKGFYVSILLLLVFTGYLVVMLLSKTSLPCTCGGIIQSLTWLQHLAFNLGMIALVVGAVTTAPRKDNKNIMHNQGKLKTCNQSKR